MAHLPLKSYTIVVYPKSITKLSASLLIDPINVPKCSKNIRSSACLIPVNIRQKTSSVPK